MDKNGVALGLAALAASVGCGSRTDLDLGALAVTTPDGGAMHDGQSDEGPPDAPPDASVDDAPVLVSDVGTTCKDACTESQTTCLHGGIASCAMGPGGCFVWGAPVPCPTGDVCSVVGGEGEDAPPPVRVCRPTPAPRAIAPLSTATVTSQRPLFRWLTGPADGAQVDVCHDRACTSVVTTFTASGQSGAPDAPLSPGVYFWRLRGTSNGQVGSLTSPVWEFFVGARSAPVNTSSGTVADVNGDGYADVLVGAPDYDGITGFVSVYLGGPGGLSTADPTMLTGGTGPLAGFGSSVASAGDVDGDGFADVVVGAPNEGGGAPGTVYLYPGGPSGLSAMPTAIPGPADHLYFGNAVASAGDVNGDGYADVLIAGPSGGTDTGGTYLAFGGPTGLSPPTMLSSSNGLSVGSAGDIDGDGFGDFVVGDLLDSRWTGAVYVYLGSASGRPGAPIMFQGDGEDSMLGYAAGGPADVNGDGYSDVVVGAPGETPSLRVYLGSPSGPSTTPATILGPPMGDVIPSFPSSAFGESVASVGDIDGDGFGDVVVGAPGSSGAGAAYVFYGGSSGLSTTAVSFAAMGTMGFGGVVAAAGDVNGDGHWDVLIGQPGDDGATGAAYLYWASRVDFPGVPAVLDGPSSRSYFGAALASLLLDRAPRRRSSRGG